MSNIQADHLRKGYGDIGLNFLVGGDGKVYEGAGYNRGSHTSGENNDSICISFIGDFSKYKAPQRQLLAAQRFLVNNVNENKIDTAYKLYGQRQFKGWDSPGKYVYDEIKTWDHWTEEV